MVVLTIIPYYNLISSGEGKKGGPISYIVRSLWPYIKTLICPYPFRRSKDTILLTLYPSTHCQLINSLRQFYFCSSTTSPVFYPVLCVPLLCLSCKQVTAKIVQASPCFSWVSCFFDTQKKTQTNLQPILRELNEYCPVFGMGGALLPHSYPRLIAMIIGANFLWLVYLWMRTAVSVFSSCQNSFCFREAPCLLWPSMDCLFSLFVV